jgi:outer membrane protein assembly factor BamB
MSEGKSTLPFIIYGNKIFMLDENELVMLTMGSSKEVPIIKNIAQARGLAFKDGKFYYINKINELRTYSLLDKSDQPLLGIKAMYQLLIRDNLLYFQNLDRGLTLFSLNLDTNEIRQVLDADIGYFVADDTYIYFSNQKDNGFLYRYNLNTGEQILSRQSPMS